MKPSLKLLLLLPAFTCPGLAAILPAYVQLDIGSYYDFDAVATQNEVATNITRTGVHPDTWLLSGTIGDHILIPGQARSYVNQASVPTNQTAIPNDGIVGKYQLSTAFDNGTDFATKSNNAIALYANNTTAIDSVTITLAPAQQASYSAFNMAFVSAISAASTAYRSWITATYTDASATIVVDTGTGTLNSFGVTNFQKTEDTSTFVNQAPGTGETIGISKILGSTYYMSTSGSGTTAYNIIRDGITSMWEFNQDIGLDPNKVLESLTISIQRGAGPTSNRNQQLHVFAISAAEVPEPATMALLCGFGALGLVIWRRRR